MRLPKLQGLKCYESYNLQYGTNFISVMPTNLYGPNDNFDLETSHVLPALIRKMHLAKLFSEDNIEGVLEDLKLDTKKRGFGLFKIFWRNADSVEIWGSGKPRREFLWSEDMADACVFIMENRNFEDTFSRDQKEIRNTHINIGTGEDGSIKELAELIKNEVGFNGALVFNTEKPDGTLKKLTDVTKLKALGWTHKVTLQKESKIYTNGMTN